MREWRRERKDDGTAEGRVRKKRRTMEEGERERGDKREWEGYNLLVFDHH